MSRKFFGRANSYEEPQKPSGKPVFKRQTSEVGHRDLSSSMGNLKLFDLHTSVHKYKLDHLASFSALSPCADLITPDEGLRQLDLMVTSSQLWQLPVWLVVTTNYTMIFDEKSGEVMETFPVQLIESPTCFSRVPLGSGRTGDVLSLTVLEDVEGQSLPEMHMFKCEDHSAEHIASKILESKSGKLQGCYVNVSSSEINLLVASLGEEIMRSTTDQENSFLHVRKPAIPSEPSRKLNQENSGIDESVAEGMEVLNHCFNDIEQFVNRLHIVEEASKELGSRKLGLKMRCRRPGSGLLSLRARGPSGQNFVEIFQKFKLSFNLLAALQTHIRDPDAPELVQFIFTPLALVADACLNIHGNLDPATCAVAPTLTSETVALLNTCLTPKEMELVRKFGDSWVTSRNEGCGVVADPYFPKFSDGWEPATDCFRALLPNSNITKV